MSGQRDSTAKNGAECMSKILQDPLRMATVLYKAFRAFVQAGFTEEQARDLTKHIFDMIVVIGGMAE